MVAQPAGMVNPRAARRRLVRRADAAHSVLGSTETHGETRLVPAWMGSLIQEIDRLLMQARPGPENALRGVSGCPAGSA
jgi:hypothetical protein